VAFSKTLPIHHLRPCQRAFQDAVVIVFGGSELTLIALEGGNQTSWVNPNPK
jgi:hypothetical protein